VIRSIRDKETQRVFTRQRSAKLPGDMQQVAYRKLRMPHNTTSLADLQIPPANGLEKLRGDRAGQYSARINDSGESVLSGERVTHTT
jgi:proteic killer suppression protein